MSPSQIVVWAVAGPARVTPSGTWLLCECVCLVSTLPPIQQFLVDLPLSTDGS